MSISRISGHDVSRAVDLALLVRDYQDLNNNSTGAVTPTPAPQDNTPQAPPAKAIDNPQRGSRWFFNRTTSAMSNRVSSSKPDQGNSGDVVQGDIRRWNRLDAEEYQALEAIPEAQESERLLRTDKPYMRRLSDVVAQRDKALPTPPPVVASVRKKQEKWSSSVSQALRDRAMFARTHGHFFEVASSPSQAFDLP